MPPLFAGLPYNPKGLGASGGHACILTGRMGRLLPRETADRDNGVPPAAPTFGRGLRDFGLQLPGPFGSCAGTGLTPSRASHKTLAILWG